MILFGIVLAAAAIAHPEAVTPGMIGASALVTGLLWLIMAATGAVSWLAALTSRPSPARR